MRAGYSFARPLRIIMDISTWVAALSFLAALLAAIYARWASFEAKRSNDLAFHTNKIEIYKDFFELKHAILQRDENINYKDTAKFYFSYLYSEFFFSPGTHCKIKEYFDICFKIAGKPIELSELNELKKKESELVKEVEQLIKAELKVAVKRRSWLV